MRLLLFAQALCPSARENLHRTGEESILVMQRLRGSDQTQGYDQDGEAT